MKYRSSPIAWLERRGVRLTPVGNDRYRCACPVHGGNPGSMGISRVDGTWIASCFACHFAGDALSLVMAIASVSFPQALIELDCKPGDRSAPVQMWKRPEVVIACAVAGCGNTISSPSKDYKVPGRCGRTWTMPADEAVAYAAEGHGWWLGVDGTVAICAEHIA